MNKAEERCAATQHYALASLGGALIQIAVGVDGQVWGWFPGHGQVTLANSAHAVAWLKRNAVPGEAADRLIRAAGPRSANALGNQLSRYEHRTPSKRTERAVAMNGRPVSGTVRVS